MSAGLASSAHPHGSRAPRVDLKTWATQQPLLNITVYMGMHSVAHGQQFRTRFVRARENNCFVQLRTYNSRLVRVPFFPLGQILT